MSYAIVEGFCLVYAISILLALSDSLGSEHEVFDIRRILIAYLAFLVTDILSRTLNGQTVQPLLALNAAANGLSLVAVSLGCFFWYRFVEDRLHPLRVPSRSYLLVTIVPVTFVCTVEALSIFTGWAFFIDSTGTYRTTEIFDYVPGIFNYLYLAIPTIVSLAFAKREKSAHGHAEYLAYTATMLLALVVGLTEDFFPDVPIVALCVFMVIHVLFVTLQGRQIWRDALTGLNNRTCLRTQLPAILAGASASRPIGLFVADVDDFGAFNEDFGYIRGDAVLRSLSRRLREIASLLDAFVARTSGDEFCLVVDLSVHSQQEVEDLLANAGQGICQNEDDVREITLSVGFVEYRDPSSGSKGLVEKARAQLPRKGDAQPRPKRQELLPVSER